MPNEKQTAQSWARASHLVIAAGGKRSKATARSFISSLPEADKLIFDQSVSQIVEDPRGSALVNSFKAGMKARRPPIPANLPSTDDPVPPGGEEGLGGRAEEPVVTFVRAATIASDNLRRRGLNPTEILGDLLAAAEGLEAGLARALLEAANTGLPVFPQADPSVGDNGHSPECAVGWTDLLQPSPSGT